MQSTRSYAAPAARNTTRQPCVRLTPKSPLIRVLVTDSGQDRFDVHELLESGPKWLASFADQDDAKAYARRRSRLPWRIVA